MEKGVEEEEPVGQEAQAPDLRKRKSSSSAFCDVCFQAYHIMGRWPMLACANGHFFCDQCIEGMFQYSGKEPVPCPVCRCLIRAALVRPHYELFRLLNKEKTVESALKHEDNQLFLYSFRKEIFEVAAAFKAHKPETICKFSKLDLSGRSISHLEHLRSFPALVYLKAHQNLIQVPRGLEELKNLRLLNLSHNLIKDVSPLEQLPLLSYLGIEFNQIQEITSLLPFSSLSHWFLYGNPLKSIVAQELLLVQFKNLLMLSFSVSQSQTNKFNAIFLKQIAQLLTMPKLYRIFLQDLQDQHLKQELSRSLSKKLEVTWIRSKKECKGSGECKGSEEHSEWVNHFMEETFQYGEVFQFKADGECPCAEDYQIGKDKITKMSNKFMLLNSAYCMSKKGKVNFKFKLLTPTPNLIVGLCGAYAKHSANIYSEHFVGLTFWGGIYVRGNYTALTAKLRIQDKPIVRMSVDFEEWEVKWFCDDMLVASVGFPEQLRHSTLHFVLAMRDVETEVSLLTD